MEFISSVGIESHDENGNSLDTPRWYIYTDSEENKEIVSEEEARELYSSYPNDNSVLGLEFIPIIE